MKMEMGNSSRGVALLLLAATWGCSSSSSREDTPPLPTQSQMTAFARVEKVLLVTAEIDGYTGVLGVDTGDPFMLLNPASFPASPQVGSSTVTVAGHAFSNVPVITSDISPTSTDASVPLGGLLGCPLLCDTIASFNYRDAVMTIGSAPSVGGLLQESTLPFDFEGGGSQVSVSGQNVAVPKSRVVVTVDIEGGKYRMIVDTGASAVVVDAATYATLTADGRAQLTSGGVQTTSGESSASYTRTKTISLGTATASDVLVAHDTSFDDNLASLTADAGETINGSLGGTFLEHFNLTIDYPNKTLHLAPYADASFIVDTARTVGFTVSATTGSEGAIVAGIVRGSDVETAGIFSGDIVTAVDGTSVVGMSYSEVEALLTGAVGTTKSITFGSAAKVSHQTLTFKILDLLPSPK